MESDIVEDFMTGPLVKWFRSCLDNPEKLVDYDDLIDGMLIREVLLQIDPEPIHHGLMPSIGNISIRMRNMDIIIKNIKALYEEEFLQVLLVVPDCIILARDPTSKSGIENMQLLLLLLLGCAVQCPNKESFIEKIKLMELDVQHAIVECIKQVTDHQNIVLTNQEDTNTLSSENLLTHIRRLVKERDHYLQNWTGSILQSQSETGHRRSSTQPGDAYHHIAVEVADWKARMRKQRQELEEKSEALVECKEELEHNKLIVSKLRLELQEVTQDARAAKAYRDELDACRERAERVDKLETEIQRYREKLADIEFYKSRVDELRHENRILIDTNEMLDDQLKQSRKRGELVLDLETEILKYKQQINELTLEKESDLEKMNELYEENAQLQLLTKTALNESSVTANEKIPFLESESGDNSLSDQLCSNAQTRALKFELENRRLSSIIENLKESSMLETNNKILDIEKDKKKLTLKVDQLQEKLQRESSQTSELKELLQKTYSQAAKSQETLDQMKIHHEKQKNEIEANKNLISTLEAKIESLTKEKSDLLSQVNNFQQTTSNLEKLSKEVEKWKAEAEKSIVLNEQNKLNETKIESLDKENQNLQKEIIKLKDIVEQKHISLDELTSNYEEAEKEITNLVKELEEAKTNLIRLQEAERESHELASRAAVDKQTLETLQKDLVAAKCFTQQIRTCLTDKLDLELDTLLEPETLIEKIMKCNVIKKAIKEKNSEISSLNELNETTVKKINIEESNSLVAQCHQLREDIGTLQATADSVHTDNARLQVHVATLQSQVSSLSTQHTALQLANSQLAAEKEEMVKERGLQQAAHQQLLVDQVMLQTLHEQLTTEYESLLNEREALKANQRDLKNEVRRLTDLCSHHDQEKRKLLQEKEQCKVESRSLTNLRAEHSSLKEDFRILFATNDKLKIEYRKLQEDHKSLRAENGQFKLKTTQLQGELASRNDHSTQLEVENTKMNNWIDMLSQTNAALEVDRRALMEHVSLLLTQYHELLTHALQDKEHYHMEEKMYTDKVNNLYRQKEKLEEKIMEHYRKMESCSTKKKGFGASFVRRVRKAGSDFMNKVPRNRRNSRAESQAALSHESADSDEGPGTTSQATCIGESDTSLDDIQQAGEIPADGLLTKSSLSLGNPGTRRAVYYTEENKQNKSMNEETSTSHDKGPFLMYNRISTVIGAGVSANEGAAASGEVRSGSPHPSVNSTKQPPNSELKSKGGKSDNSIWYEYGCV